MCKHRAMARRQPTAPLVLLLLLLAAGRAWARHDDSPARALLASTASSIYRDGEGVASAEQPASKLDRPRWWLADGCLPLLSHPAPLSPYHYPCTPPAIAGQLSWRSWSWGLSSLNVRDGSAPMPGARLAMCAAVQPFGALSLRSAAPFPLEGALEFFIRGSNTTAEALGSLELQVGNGAAGGRTQGVQRHLRAPWPPLTPPACPLRPASLQFESSAPSRYSITRSLPLAELLAAQAAEGGSASADQLLVAMAAGQWTGVKVPLASFAPPHQGTDAAVFRADRLTVGLCLQRLDGCSAATPAVEFCLQQVQLTGPAAAR